MVDFDPVGTISFFRERHRVESLTTAAVLRAFPPDGLSYSPHVSSSTAGTTAWTIVRCLRICNHLADSPAAQVTHDNCPSHDVLITQFEQEGSSLAEKLLRISQREWLKERSVLSGDHLLLKQPLGQILWLFHVDAIHHRGQISTFLRGLGARVPSIYGPSGDFKN
jgi:uncharacterized damage-inducible protein DinB